MASGNYPIVQSNGERIYQSPVTPAVRPPRGCEIFVGNLPRDLFEDQLIPLFSQVGPIWKFRLMMDFSDKTRGFCFLRYFNTEHANLAVLRFNETRIRSATKSSFMTVHLSVDNCRLFLGRIPREVNNREVKDELSYHVDGINKVILHTDKRDPRRNRGYAFVEFESHAAAAIARRRLQAGVVGLWGNLEGNELCIDWAQPEPLVNPRDLQDVKILYFKSIPVEWTVNRFKEFTLQILRTYRLEKIFKRDNYAFIHFYERREAEKALRLLNQHAHLMKFGNQQIEVEWARPTTYSKKNTSKEVPNNFCLSVPPRTRKLIYKSKYSKNGNSHDGGSTSNSTASPRASSGSISPSTSGGRVSPGTSGGRVSPSTSGGRVSPSTSGGRVSPSTSGGSVSLISDDSSEDESGDSGNRFQAPYNPNNFNW